MAYEPAGVFLQALGYWQTLIAGGLAVAAALATIWTTIWAGNREVAAAQSQIEAAARLERRRIAAEKCSFFAMLDAAMVTLADDIEAARELVKDERGNVAMTRSGYEARQRLKKTGFSDLRSAFVQHGGSLTVSFLRLDKDIDKYAGQYALAPTGGADVKVGLVRGLFEQLDSIASQSASIRESAAIEMKRYASHGRPAPDGPAPD